MTYDHWKTTEPDDGDEPPVEDDGSAVPTAEDELLAALHAIVAVGNNRSIDLSTAWQEVMNIARAALHDHQQRAA